MPTSTSTTSGKGGNDDMGGRTREEDGLDGHEGLDEGQMNSLKSLEDSRTKTGDAFMVPVE